NPIWGYLEISGPRRADEPNDRRVQQGRDRFVLPPSLLHGADLSDRRRSRSGTVATLPLLRGGFRTNGARAHRRPSGAPDGGTRPCGGCRWTAVSSAIRLGSDHG